MKRIVSAILAVAVICMPLEFSFAQASKYRVPTQADSIGNAPSFRGGNQPSFGGQQVYSSPSQISGRIGGADAMLTPDMMGMGYQVHVLGEVANPGTMKVTASERLSEVIKKAGGFTQNGSERRIELRRKDHVIKVVDLLEFKLHGRLDENPYLTDNDVIYVPLRNKVIQVVGSVRRPDIYELKNEKSLFDAVELAGGFSAALAKSEPIRVVRFVDGKKETSEISTSETEMKQFFIENGDVIVVPNLITQETKFDYNIATIPGDQVFYPSYEDRVFVLGGVAYPGAYEFSPYYTLNQYLSLAGGLSDRGVEKYKVISFDGKEKKAHGETRINPGDTVMVKERWMSPAGWMAFALSIASFGLSASATVLALTRR